MEKVEVFKNELRNYIYYINSSNEMSRAFNSLKGADNIKKCRILLPYSKELRKAYDRYEETWYALRGVGAIKYDAMHIDTSQYQRDQAKLDQIERYNKAIDQIGSIIPKAEKDLAKELKTTLNAKLRIEMVLNRMKPSTVNTLIDIYCKDRKYEEVARELGYSKSGLYKLLQKELKKVISEPVSQKNDIL